MKNTQPTNSLMGRIKSEWKIKKENICQLGKKEAKKRKKKEDDKR